MTPEVAGRLKEISVDPKTVTVRKAPAASEVGVPKPAVPLKAGTMSYRAKVELGPQSMEMDITTEIREEGDTIVVTETAKSAAGDAVDRTVLDKDRLTVRSRSVTQGTVKVEFSVEDGKLTGTMNMGGQEKALRAELGGELFGDGAGSNQVIATLPLEPGYKAAFRNYDLRTQSVQALQLSVVGTEQVKVPAGTFDTVKAEMLSGDGSKMTLWVARNTHALIRVSAVSMAMSGATITSELVK